VVQSRPLKLRAVMIANPNAGRWSERSRSDVIEAVRDRFDVDVYSTTARGTGMELAAEIADQGEQLVVAFGGDGHVNEVVNGLAGTECTLGIIPGGTMNVFARCLKVPTNPLDAVAKLAQTALKPARTVPLGLIDDRYFTFSAGCGFDAEAAERVERYVPAKRRYGEMWFYWSAFRVLAGSYRRRSPTMIAKGAFGELPISMAIASNCGPYAYLGERPVRIAPNVSLHKGIDLFALKSMRIEALPLYAWRVMVSGNLTEHRDVFYCHDLREFELVSTHEFSRHADGEPLRPARKAKFSVVPNALKVSA
jgi:diacylglycerol kinase family enzyme